MEGEPVSQATEPPPTRLPVYPPEKKKKQRPFVFDQHPSRKIALRLAYHGHVHDGLAIQKETANTVEGLLCEALKRLRFIPESGPEQMARCGRTDKGVSALSNCMSFIARASCRPEDVPQLPPIDYCTKLNHVLPSTIRVIGFAHVGVDFDARFSCRSRTYRYYFYHRGLHLDAMREAVRYMVGTHSFRNFCVLDVVNVSNFERTIESAEIHQSESLPEYISYLELKANSFLYHQVRCTMEILFLVGRQLEPPTIVKTLLERGDCKPQYGLADSTPLVLWECHFGDAVQWCMTRNGFQEVERQLQDISTALLIRATSAEAMRRQLFEWYQDTPDCLLISSTPGNTSNTTNHAEKTETQSTTTAGQNCHNHPHSSDVGVVRRREGEQEDDVDEWSVAGCDWTQPRSEDLRRARRSSLMHEMRKRQQKTHTNQEAKPSANSEVSVDPQIIETRQRLVGYVPLLDRPTERTFDEQVKQLSGTKRARYELNVQLKEAGKKENEGKVN